jgi:hypothetical protein
MEEYKLIEGHENYSVSNFGNVRNNKTGKNLKGWITEKGYKRIELTGKRYYVHRLVAIGFIPNSNNKLFVDHINNDRTSNRVTNLRWVTHQENCYNTSITSKNKSGHKGVGWCKNLNKWRASIKHNQKSYHIGYFDKIEDAFLARQQKANELFGEFTNASERIVNLNINLPPSTKLNININVEGQH